MRYFRFLLTKKTIFGLTTAIIGGIILWQHLASQDLLRGGSSLLKFAPFVDEQMVVENHFDVYSATTVLTEGHVADFEVYFRNVLPGWLFEIRVVTSGGSSPGIDWTDTKDLRIALLCHQNPRSGLLVADDLCVNVPLAYFMTYRGAMVDQTKLTPEQREEMLLTVNQARGSMVDLKRRIFEYNPSLGENFDLAFTWDEIESLSSFATTTFGMTYIFLSSLSPTRHEEIEFLSRCMDVIYNSWPLVYSNAVDPSIVRWNNTRQRLGFLGLVALFVISFAYLVRRDAVGIIREEMLARGMSLRDRSLWRIVLSNWRFLCLPVAEPKMRERIARQCDRIRDKRIDQELKRRGQALWSKVGKWSDVADFKYLYDTAIASAEPFSKRERAANDLANMVRRREKSKSRITPVWTEGPVFSRSSSDRTIRRRDLIKEIENFDVEPAFVDRIREWSTARLENFTIALAAYDDFFGARGVRSFYRQPEKRLVSLLDNHSSLMRGIRTGDRELLADVIDLPLARNAGAVELSLGQEQRALSDKKVVIVGSARLERSLPRLEGVLYSLGADNVTFCEKNEITRLAKMSRTSNSVFILVRSGLSHSCSEALKSRGIEPIVVNRMGPSRFRQEIFLALQK